MGLVWQFQDGLFSFYGIRILFNFYGLLEESILSPLRKNECTIDVMVILNLIVLQ